MTAYGRSRRLRPVLILILLASLAAGCSTGTTTSGLGFVDARGNHPSGWIGTHPAFARPAGKACTDCHGDDLGGGISGVSCFTASRNGQGCHATGPAFHPANWLDKTGGNFHGAAFQNDVLVNNLACTGCHDPNNPAEPPGFICLDCHFSIDGRRVPSGSSYVHGQITGHGAFFPDNAVISVCMACHETNNTFGHTPQPFCHNCHEPFPTAFHPTGWANPDAHGASAKSAPAVSSGFAFCQSCHGTNFAGSGSAPSCINNALCHGSGVVSPHSPAPWRTPLSSRTHTGTATGNAGVCGLCHLGGGTVVITPPTPVPGGITPGCFNNTLCHGDVSGAPHAVRPFPDHPTRARNEFTTFCNQCHSINPPRIVSGAPACTECHAGGNPLTVVNCASCHANPPNGQSPAGNVFPNVEGGHTEHDTLDNVTGICNTCHNGGGTGRGLEHFYDNAVDVAFQNVVYKARSGNLLFTSADNTCTNVSCHGGTRTPNWRTGAIDVNAHAGCVQCHALGTALGTPENNSPYSGLHSLHLGTTVGGVILCTECHRMNNGSAGANNHFRFLNTPGMEGPAGDTVEPNGSAANYTPSTRTCGTFTCHTQPHGNFSWEGGANHGVPFLGATHTSVTSSTFPANCGACHFETGGSTKIGPTCTVCHQSGSPLTLSNCTSCHAEPPAGAAYPDIAGRHAVHVALNVAGTPVSCATCHNGLESGSQAHYDRANARPGKDALRVSPGDAAFTATYNARSGPSAFNSTAFTCSNVSCHGGQATPHWRTGTIDVNAQCTSCHQLGTGPGTPQYNVYWSGEHDRNQHVNAGCTACHDTSKLADPAVGRHFLSLGTTALDVRGSVTVGGGATRVVTYSPGGTVGTGSCTPQSGVGCHGTQNW